jgi:WD40 repeat protein
LLGKQFPKPFLEYDFPGAEASHNGNLLIASTSSDGNLYIYNHSLLTHQSPGMFLTESDASPWQVIDGTKDSFRQVSIHPSRPILAAASNSSIRLFAQLV